MRFTIRGSKTSHSDSDLCKHCRHCIRTQGRKLDEVLNQCQIHDKLIPFPVDECSSFEDKLAMTKYEMTQIAWKIGLDRKTQKIGFYSPKDYRKHKLDDNPTVEFPLPKPDDDDIF